ncbi:MAG TPA: MFS transporter, partial [Candidatus Limnocylindrales bacterium]
MAATTAQRPSLFHHRNFVRLWTAATVSLFGTQISQIAIPFIAAVLLGASAAEVGLLTTIEFLPFLLFTLPAGVWVDRSPKRRILVIGDLGRAVMLATIPIAYVFGALTIWQLYVVGFVNGLMTVFFDVADQSYLPTILERDELIEGNSKLQVSGSSAQILGQPIGGAIVALLSAPIAVLFDAASYLASAGLILSIREHLGRGRASAAAEAPNLVAAVAGDAGLTPMAEAAQAGERTGGPGIVLSGTVEAEPSATDDEAAGTGAGAGAASAETPAGMRQQILDGLRFIRGHEYLG